ncbi:MAG: ABC transporter ATP-binding protein [Flavobacteriales bacterium]|nr:ABC transporter ATP-binding protein [Flavobacteriales bacterium]
MQITLHDIGKRFGKHWLFKGISAEFKSGDRIGITGINGSGKSTFLQIAAGISIPSEGKVEYDGEKLKSADDLAGQLAMISPYMDVPEQLKLEELYHFHSRFIPMSAEMDLEKFTEITLLKGKESHLVKSFSSGMKQRLKLGLAFLSKARILMLDEPCSNLDEAGKSLYKELLMDYSNDRLILIASNEAETELLNTTQRIDLMDYKVGT